MVKPKKVIALLSGGLDSMLAAGLVKNWGFEVIGVTFKTPFWGVKGAKRAAKALGIPLKVVDISIEHFEILKSPKHGFGKNMNPCIDCHALMLRKAKGLMGKPRGAGSCSAGEGASFIVTGEVLGERPFSQNKKALSIVEREAGIRGVLVRPLSGKLLPPTLPEKKGWIKREWLLDIQGRQRKRQLELAKKLGIKDFATPAGGCLLTDPAFSERVKALFENFADPKPQDAELLKHGRVFWKDKALIVVGRDDEENKKLAKLAKSGDVLIEMKDIPGPTALVRGKITAEVKKKAKELVRKYAKKARGKRVEWEMEEIEMIRDDKG